jgi:soluble lytic murein transglycosylase-like protein
MADLSQIKQRIGLDERRITDHREGIISSDRDTRAPQREFFGDMRAGARGDGAAEELMKTLGVVNKAASALGGVADAQYAKDEDRRGAQGSIDEQSGTVDAELMRKSHAYASSVTTGRTMSAWNSHLRDFDQDLRGFIEHQDDPHLEVRQGQVRQKLDTFFSGFALDPETGQPRDFLGSPEAKRWLAGQMKATRVEVEKNASARIEQRFHAEALGHFAQNIQDQAENGNGVVDPKVAWAILPPTVPQEEAKKTFVSTVLATAAALKASGRYEDGQRLLNQLAGAGPVASAVERVDLPPSNAAPGNPPAASAAAPAAPRDVPFSVLARAVMGRESGGDADAVSPKGAVGTMQTMPFTLRDPGFGVRPAKDNSPAELERVGKDYLKAMQRRYGDTHLALAAYNAGPGMVDDWLHGTNKTGKNPGLARLDDPRKTGDYSAFVNAIPYKETRDYVAAIASRVGLGSAGTSGDGFRTPTDPVTANPSFRMPDAPLDPIEKANRQAVPSLLPHFTGPLELSVEDRARIAEYRDSYAREVKAEWRRNESERHERNATAFVMGLYGQGRVPTTQDITEAVQAGHVDPRDAAAMFQLMRTNQDRLATYQDRETSRQERDAAKLREKEADHRISRYIGAMLKGEETPAQVRTRALREAVTIRDPQVQRAVLQAVAVETDRLEGIRSGTPAARGALDTIARVEDQHRSTILDRAPPQVREVWMARMRASADTARRNVANAIASGENPQDAMVRETQRMNDDFQSVLSGPTRRHPMRRH